MEAAFVFEAVVAGVLGFDALFGGAGAVPVAHGNVGIGQGVGRDAVRGHVGGNLGIGPVEDGIDLEGFFLLLGEGAVDAGGALAAAQAGEPDIATQFLQRAVHGLDFVEQCIFLVALFALFPELAVERFLSGGGELGRVGAEIDRPFLHQGLDVVVGLGEKVAGIDEDDGNFRRMVVDEVQHHRRL